jgi:hypothetical protein
MPSSISTMESNNVKMKERMSEYPGRQVIHTFPITAMQVVSVVTIVLLETIPEQQQGHPDLTLSQ